MLITLQIVSHAKLIAKYVVQLSYVFNANLAIIYLIIHVYFLALKATIRDYNLLQIMTPVYPAK
jgi:hypothetical protein